MNQRTQPDAAEIALAKQSVSEFDLMISILEEGGGHPDYTRTAGAAIAAVSLSMVRPSRLIAMIQGLRNLASRVAQEE